MVSSIELRRIAAFSKLPEDQINRFLSHVQEVLVQAGEAFVRQGEPADWMVIFLEGLFQWRGEFGGETVSLPAQAGDVSGVSFLRHTKKGAARLTAPSVLFFLCCLKACSPEPPLHQGVMQ